MNQADPNADLLAALDWEPVLDCDWSDSTVVGKCHEPGRWHLLFRKVCSEGSEIKAPHSIILCDVHKKRLLKMMNPWSNFSCLSCRKRVTGIDHMIERVTLL